MLEGQRPGGNLRADQQCKRPRLRRVERDAELARVGIEAPQRDEGSGRAGCGVCGGCGPGRVNGVGDGCSGGHVQHQLAQFALGRSDGNVMGAFNHTGAGHIELGHLGIEHRLLALDVAAARLPGDADVVGGREHERGDGVAAGGVALDGDRLRREHVHVEIDDRELELVDKAARHGQSDPLSVSSLVTGNSYCTLMSKVPRFRASNCCPAREPAGAGMRSSRLVG